MSASSQAISVAEKLSNKSDRQLLVILVCSCIAFFMSLNYLLWTNQNTTNEKFISCTQDMTAAVVRQNIVTEQNTSVLLQVKSALERK